MAAKMPTSQLLDHREVSPRARIITEAVADLLPGTAVSVYLLMNGYLEFLEHRRASWRAVTAV
jgi:hypothetical protein